MKAALAVVTAMAMLARPAHADGGAYATPSYWLGAGTAPSAAVSPPSTLRNAIGVTGDRAAPFCGRAGLTLDLASRGLASNGNTFLGLEAQVDWKISDSWHLGPRLATTFPRDGIAIAMLGGRARTDALSLGIDFAYTSQSGPFGESGFTVLGGVGLEGKAGAIATGVEAGVFLVLLAALLAALSHEGT